MTVTPTYPGVYIEELPSLVHTIQAAPTSVAVFVGYTHPFLSAAIPTDSTGAPTGAASPATLLFSFSDYQTNFGGFFSSPWQPDYVGQAVYQFFLNGGQQCYVVGLPAMQYYSKGKPISPSAVDVAAATADLAGGSDTLVLQALQPVGVDPGGGAATYGVMMTATVSNIGTIDPSHPERTLADVVIAYGSSVETYRRVTMAEKYTDSNGAVHLDLKTAMAGSRSRLAKVTSVGPGSSPGWSANVPAKDFTYATVPEQGLSIANPSGWTVLNPDEDFGAVFQVGASLDKVPVFNLLITPGISDNPVASLCVAYAEAKRAFYIMDTPSSAIVPATAGSSVTFNGTTYATGWDANDLVQNIGGSSDTSPSMVSTIVPVSINSALYYPWLQTTDPISGNPMLNPPSGYVAGMFGQEDNNQGVWKSPAGIETSLLGTTGVDPNGFMNDQQQGVLNVSGPPLNCIRQLAGAGTVIFGARTTAAGDLAYQQWKYVAVRRMALFIEQSLYQSLTWAVFQGNAQPLWDALVQETTAFMLGLFRQGAFAGTTPSQAFLVQCDSTTTTPADVANGVVNILVGFAPLVPAEFVVIQIAQLAGQAQS
jgi:uncharacterized protein